DELSTRPQGEQPVVKRRPRIADMQIAGRRRREADGWAGHAHALACTAAPRNRPGGTVCDAGAGSRSSRGTSTGLHLSLKERSTHDVRRVRVYSRTRWFPKPSPGASLRPLSGRGEGAPSILNFRPLSRGASRQRSLEG